MRTGIKRAMMSLIKDAVMRTGIGKDIFSVYNYMYNPEQLRFLMDVISDTASISGSCVEVGCAFGTTTALLRKWMICKGINKKYYAIDTFSGFRPEHIEHEIVSRKKPPDIRYPFSLNKKEWFDYSLKVSGVEDVISVEADAAKFDFSTVSPISFCLLDVDLYQPIAAALPRIYDACSPGGVIVCDDCAPDVLYDGALQAYEEFVNSRRLEKIVKLGKLGIIRKA